MRMCSNTPDVFNSQAQLGFNYMIKMSSLFVKSSFNISEFQKVIHLLYTTNLYYHVCVSGNQSCTIHIFIYVCMLL